MAITASKSAINIREKLAELDQPQGIKGTEVLRADTADEARNAIGARGRKNLIINGGFDVWQRGTSSVSNGYGSADRWTVNSTASTHSQQTFTAGQTEVAGNPKYHYRFATVASTGRQFYQFIENISQFSGQTVTISYYAKADTALDVTVQSGQYFDGSSNVYTGEGTHSVTTSWSKFTQTFTIPSQTGKTIGANSSLRLCFSFEDGTNTYAFDIAQVQLELGNQATEFEHRSYGEELALCQRYYQKHNRLNMSGHGYGTGGDGNRMNVLYPTTMRTTPTHTDTNFTDGGSYCALYVVEMNESKLTFDLRSTNSTYSNWGRWDSALDAEL